MIRLSRQKCLSEDHMYYRNPNFPTQNDMWAESPFGRLGGATQVSDYELNALRDTVSRGCPTSGWPYGMPTVLNPYVVILGISPGASPASGDNDYASRPSYEMPTLGTAHPRWPYIDSRGYWDKVRHLCLSLNQAVEPALNPMQASALSGHMNLSTEASGQAASVVIDETMATWVTSVISNHLRPRYVIGVGLWTALKDPAIRKAMLALGRNSVDFTKPDRIKPFEGYPKKNLYFREWDFERPDGKSLTLVLWPQHPSRAPFTNVETWNQSVFEYCKSTGKKHRIPKRGRSGSASKSGTA
jgi:hypothetical protein